MVFSREQLENVVQKKKVSELHSWMLDHFANSSIQEYRKRCPLLIVQGPTGCGKTSTLKCLARELKILVRIYSETFDTSSIDFELRNMMTGHDDEQQQDRIDRRRAIKFEYFVLKNIQFNLLYPDADEPLISMLPCADSEMESDDDFPTPAPRAPPPRPPGGGVIILVESQLTFARSQRVFNSSVTRLIKSIQEMSKVSPRRVAVVFESLECVGNTLTFSTKLKAIHKVQTIKFNPITRANMKKFVESLLKNYHNLMIDRDTVELLVSDCDGDLRACLNTIELLRTKTHHNFNNVFMSLNNNDLSNFPNEIQVNKRQKLNPERIRLDATLMRDITRSSNYFHILGKVFYQKRLYPDLRYVEAIKRPRPIDRPYQTENNTEHLTNKLSLNPKDLLGWLHQHYYKFCENDNCEKASLLLDHLSDIDTISIDSTQSSQYYEMHKMTDHLQTYLAVDATVYSLYKDQSNVTKTSHKKISTNKGSFILKPSVENSSSSGSNDLYSFNKPVSFTLSRVADANLILLTDCSTRLTKQSSYCSDLNKVLLDYVPYLSRLSEDWRAIEERSQSTSQLPMTKPHILDDVQLTKLVKTIERLDCNFKNVDYELQHDKLRELIEELNLT